ncbi:hypothetical protein J6590_005407 [Homalodisca vitripennis]|nr:hypothetical protein J6590_005407 [Homalodisca vitripennis]
MSQLRKEITRRILRVSHINSPTPFEEYRWIYTSTRPPCFSSRERRRILRLKPRVPAQTMLIPSPVQISVFTIEYNLILFS